MGLLLQTWFHESTQLQSLKNSVSDTPPRTTGHTGHITPHHMSLYCCKVSLLGSKLDFLGPLWRSWKASRGSNPPSGTYSVMPFTPWLISAKWNLNSTVNLQIYWWILRRDQSVWCLGSLYAILFTITKNQPALRKTSLKRSLNLKLPMAWMPKWLLDQSPSFDQRPWSDQTLPSIGGEWKGVKR